MRSLAALLAALLTVLTLVLSAPLEQRASLVPPPQDDDFYRPPKGFASTRPGTVLKTRPVVLALFGLVPVPIQGWQLLYRTTALNGSAIATVTTVMKPLGAKTDRVVNFATAEDSNAPSCAPSYNYRLGANQTNSIVAVENLIIQLYLASGYIVNSPDYEGPDGAFGAGRLAGRGVLDSMRAVQNSQRLLGLSVSSPAFVGVGYSGGAIATGWAASLYKRYAPELKIKGWAAGGTPANLTAVTEFIDGGFWAGFLPAAVQGLSEPSSYGALTQPLIAEYARPAGLAALAYAKSHCATDDLSNFSYKSIQSTDFQSLGDRFLYQETIHDILVNQTMGYYKKETPLVPIKVYHSVNDEIIPYPATLTAVQSWCANGATVQFTKLAQGGHITGELYGAFAVVPYVNDVFAGKVPATGKCTYDTDLGGTLNPLALGASLEPILFKLIDFLHAVGTSDANFRTNPSLFGNPPKV